MKRICGYCKANMGEKCGRCGSFHVVQIVPHGWKCMTCGRTWWAGADPVTTGICEKCLAKATARFHAA